MEINRDARWITICFKSMLCYHVKVSYILRIFINKYIYEYFLFYSNII